MNTQMNECALNKNIKYETQIEMSEWVKSPMIGLLLKKLSIVTCSDEH